jgi:hypothetical protein
MKKFDLEEVRFRTTMQKSRLESFRKLLEDPDKEKRLADQECVICYYSGKIGGAAMTDSHCGICDTTMHFGSTNVDRLCTVCAEKHKLCKHCGADMDYKNRNKL